MANNLASEFGDGRQMALRAADSQEQEKHSKGFVTELLQSAAYSGLQAPVHGVTQLIDRGLGTNLTKASTFIDRPQEATNFADWHAQQIGGAIGMVLPFALVNFGVHKAGNALIARGGAQTAESLGVMSMRRAITESAIAGGIYEGVFTASSDKEGLLSGRLRNATHGALTFGALTGSARALHDFGGMRSRIGIGVASGLPAGFVSAESESLLHGKGFAKGDDVAKNMYTFAMAGGVLSAIHSIPLGERGGKTGAEKANENVQPAEPSRAQSVEFRIANEQSRAALEAFRSGEKQTAWADVLKAGEPKRLFVQHDGAIPFEVGTRADFVACCNMPEVSPFARNLAVPEAYNKPLFMDLAGDRVRISTEKMTPESVELAKDNIAKVRSLLDGHGIDPDTMPRWMSRFKPTGKVWSGNNATVLELAPTEGMPDVVLKIKRGDFEGQRDWEADIYNYRGEIDPTAVHETSNGTGEEPLYIFLEDRVDYGHHDTTGYNELMDLLQQRGLQVSDPGSGPPVGRSRNTGKWVVADRDAVSKVGSGEHEVERAFALGADEYESQLAQEEDASRDRWDDGYGEFDSHDEAAKQAAVSGLHVEGTNLEIAKKLFGLEDPKAVDAAVKSLVDQMTDGLSTKEDVQILQQWDFNKGDGAAAKKQIDFVAKLLKAAKVRANDWVK